MTEHLKEGPIDMAQNQLCLLLFTFNHAKYLSLVYPHTFAKLWLTLHDDGWTLTLY